MGITTSSNPNSPFDKYLSKEVGYGRKEHFRRWFAQELEKELDAVFAPKPEELFIDRDKEAEARFYEFMRGGPCKESFNAMEECREEAGIPSEKCRETLLMFFKCAFYSHPDYYHPYVAVIKSISDNGDKEIQALDAMKKSLKDDALSARNQAFNQGFRDNRFRRFR